MFHWQGLDLQVVPTPGPTDGSVSYVTEVDGKKLAFTGDLIFGPGQLWNFYMLQKRFPGCEAITGVSAGRRRITE